LSFAATSVYGDKKYKDNGRLKNLNTNSYTTANNSPFALFKNDNTHKSLQPIGIKNNSLCSCEGNCPRCRINNDNTNHVPSVIQAKLKVSQPSDEYEQEADMVAEKVMSISSSQVSNLQIKDSDDENYKIDRKYKSCEDDGDGNKENLKEIHIKRKGTNTNSSNTLDISDSTANNIKNIVKQQGSPLDTSTREFMEQRFGYDFSNIKIHNDNNATKSAKSINALAYTIGNNVIFGVNNYNTNTVEGKKLLAHELTHVVQQNDESDRIKQSFGRLHNNEYGSTDPILSSYINSEPQQKETSVHQEKPISKAMQRKDVFSIQRKIEVREPTVKLENYFNSHNIPTTRYGNVYKSVGATFMLLIDQILSNMLVSGRTFYLHGYTQAEAEDNLNRHVNSRKGIVDFAKDKKYGFAAGTNTEMNSEYWINDPIKGWIVKPGADQKEAMNDLNKKYWKYYIACERATKITMAAGSGFSDLGKNEDVKSTDWIPGDWGYISNTGFIRLPENQGFEGENIIYMGNGLFWGHGFSPAERTLDNWIDEVLSWNGGAELYRHRWYPLSGLFGY